MKKIIISLVMTVAFISGSKSVSGQANLSENTKFKEEALKLINLPEPTFKPFKVEKPSSQIVTETDLKQVYKTIPTKFTMKDGKYLFANRFKKNSRTTIILIHGVLSNSSDMNKTGGLLHEILNAEVLAVDLRGHGKSEGKPGDVDFIDQYALDLAEIVEKVRKDNPQGKIILAGHSMGGGICLRYAQNKTFPKVEGFLLFAPLLGQNTPTVPQASAVTQANEEPFLKIHIGRIIGLKMLNSIGISEHNGLNVLFFNPPAESSLRNYTYRANESMSPEDYKEGLKAVKNPLLVLVGTKDEAFVASAFEQIVRENSDGEVFIIKDATHNGIKTNPEALKKIKHWVQKNLAVPK